MKFFLAVIGFVLLTVPAGAAEPEASPPVPTMSTGSGGALTRSILLLMAEAAPVTSSTVSPRTRIPINNPPIWEDVAWPDIMISKAVAVSSRVSVAPVATLLMIDLRAFIALRVLSRSNWPVARASATSIR